MVKTIKIFNPKDRNYGVLSNNYIQPMTIGSTGKERGMDKTRKGMDLKYRYPSVTKYIYISMLSSPQYKEVMLQTKSGPVGDNRITSGPVGDKKDFHTTFVKLFQQEKIDVIRKAIDAAYKTKIENNTELVDKLLSTNNSPLKYVDGDEILGIGPDGTGQNLIGKYLEQIRRQLILSYKYKTNQKLQEKLDYTTYEAYIAEKALLKAIQEEGNDLKKYIGKTPTQIIDMMGRAKLLQNSLPLDVVTKLSYQGLINIPYPMNLALTIRGKELRKLRSRQQDKRLKTIFDMYADYTIKKNFPNLPLDKYAEAREQQIDKIGEHSLLEMQKTIANLYEKGGVLSKSLSDNIKSVLGRINVPTEEEIIEAEAVDIKTGSPKENNIIAPYQDTSGNPVYIYSTPTNFEEAEYTMFSHLNSDITITIDKRTYPTISHYITFSLICAIPGITPVEAYKNLLGATYDTVILRYNQLYDINYRERLIEFMQIGLDTKFQDRVAQDELLATGDDDLVWNDPSDQILGPKENMVGKYLMKIRKELKKHEKIHPIGADDITTIVEQDPFLKKWLQMRVTDMCQAIYLMKKSYLDEDAKITAKLVTSVLDKVYQPCSHIFVEAKNITDQAPRFFRIMVQHCPGFAGVGEDVVIIMWKRIAVMLHYLIAQDPFGRGPHNRLISVRDIRSMLNKIENMVSKSDNCVRIMDNESDNCIASALVNLLVGITQFNKEFSVTTDIGKKDIAIATSIILNKDISDEIQPNVDEDLMRNFYSPGVNNLGLTKLLDDMDEVKDVSEIKAFISGAIDTIKTYPMSKTVKTNRINFFATQR